SARSSRLARPWRRRTSSSATTTRPRLLGGWSTVVRAYAVQTTRLALPRRGGHRVHGDTSRPGARRSTGRLPRGTAVTQSVPVTTGPRAEGASMDAATYGRRTELASREGNGVTVRLLWDRATNLV